MKYIIVIIMLMTNWLVSINSAPYSEKKDSVQIIYTNLNGKGLNLTIDFNKGKKHNHALIAIWIEDISGHYVQTLYVSKSIAKGSFEHAIKGKGKWLPGEVRRPAALPYWSFKRGVQEKDGLYIPTPKTAIPDAYTGATPLSNFILRTKTDLKPPEKFRILFEINQAFDYNEYWTSTLFPNDNEYHTSAQPSLIYSVEIDSKFPKEQYFLHLIGHGNYSGKNGNLFTNTSTISSALQIVKNISVKIVE
ncbi:MAG: hypothetical protein ABIJ97_15735 [Bacteroidota bacterium]